MHRRTEPLLDQVPGEFLQRDAAECCPSLQSTEEVVRKIDGRPHKRKIAYLCVYGKVGKTTRTTSRPTRTEAGDVPAHRLE